MPRPRTVTDAAILDAAGAIASREGPAALTFAAVGSAAGLAPATLVQRYGSRDALLRATLLRMWDQLDAATARADARRPVSVEGAIRLLVALSGQYGPDGDAAAQGLLLLREDFRDPVLRARGVAWGDALARALGRRLSADPAEQEVLGRLMASQWQGAILWWGFYRRGSIRAFVRRELGQWCKVVLGGAEEMP